MQVYNSDLYLYEPICGLLCYNFRGWQITETVGGSKSFMGISFKKWISQHYRVVNKINHSKSEWGTQWSDLAKVSKINVGKKDSC